MTLPLIFFENQQIHYQFKNKNHQNYENCSECLIFWLSFRIFGAIWRRTWKFQWRISLNILTSYACLILAPLQLFGRPPHTHPHNPLPTMKQHLISRIFCVLLHVEISISFRNINCVPLVPIFTTGGGGGSTLHHLLWSIIWTK